MAMRGWGIVNSGRGHDLIIEEQQVEVERSLAPTYGPGPAESLFDLLENVQQAERVKSRLQHGCGVQERALTGRSADRFRLMERADVPDDDPARAPQGRDGSLERALAVAQVAAQGDAGERGHSHTAYFIA